MPPFPLETSTSLLSILFIPPFPSCSQECPWRIMLSVGCADRDTGLNSVVRLNNHSVNHVQGLNHSGPISNSGLNHSGAGFRRQSGGALMAPPASWSNGSVLKRVPVSILKVGFAPHFPNLSGGPIIRLSSLLSAHSNRRRTRRRVAREVRAAWFGAHGTANCVFSTLNFTPTTALNG